MYLVYKTDNQHSYASRDVLGVATGKFEAVKICKRQIMKEGEEIDQEQLGSFYDMKQTQGYTGEGEFVLEEIEVNRLLVK